MGSHPLDDSLNFMRLLAPHSFQTSLPGRTARATHHTQSLRLSDSNSFLAPRTTASAKL
jgi:hypothetical protein